MYAIHGSMYGISKGLNPSFISPDMDSFDLILILRGKSENESQRFLLKFFLSVRLLR